MKLVLPTTILLLLLLNSLFSKVLGIYTTKAAVNIVVTAVVATKVTKEGSTEKKVVVIKVAVFGVIVKMVVIVEIICIRTVVSKIAEKEKQGNLTKIVICFHPSGSRNAW